MIRKIMRKKERKKERIKSYLNTSYCIILDDHIQKKTLHRSLTLFIYFIFDKEIRFILYLSQRNIYNWIVYYLIMKS